jgi:type IV secretion system protein VirB5
MVELPPSIGRRSASRCSWVSRAGWIGWKLFEAYVVSEGLKWWTASDVNVKTMEGAKRQFVELYGSALVMNTYLKIALVLVCLVALALVALNFHTASRFSDVKPLVIRIDEVGRAEAVQYDATRYQPQPPELRFFLTQFVVKHFSRIRSTVQREYPDSLFFLAPALADATIAENDQSRTIEKFMTNPSADEIEVQVQNVSLTELAKPPFKAAVMFQKVHYSTGTRTERQRETFVAQVDFALRDHVPNEFVPVNPLGLQIDYFRIDRFEDIRR